MRRKSAYHRSTAYLGSPGLRHHEPAERRALYFFVILFYIDEAGNPDPHQEPLFDGQTPLFCLSAIAVRSEHWRSLDRALLGLKRKYFAVEMAVFATRNPDRRPEHFEVKGSYLCKPSNARLYRNRVFVFKVLDILRDYDARLFASIWRKDPANPASPVSIYTHSLQILTERFHHHCEAQGRPGLMIIDSRTKKLDAGVAAGHLSFLFGNPVGRGYTSITEAPLFADSSLSAGVQYADIIGATIYGNYYQRRCSDIAGHFHGADPISSQRFAAIPPERRTVRQPARDYIHCGRYWSALEALQFRRGDVAAPGHGTIVGGFYGFRELGVLSRPT